MNSLSFTNRPRTLTRPDAYYFLTILHILYVLYFPGFICISTVKLGDKEHFDKEQIGVKEPFLVINCQFKDLVLRNNFRVTKKFLITMFDFTYILLDGR